MLANNITLNNFGVGGCFGDKVSLHSPDCPGTHTVNQAGLKVRDLPVSDSQVLRLKVCTTLWPD